MNLWQKIIDWFGEGFDNISGIFKFLSNDPAVWEADIRKFEAQDRLKPPPDKVIVFAGSSSITFWSTLEQDMAPLPVINRGFGGSRINEVVFYADRIVIPYRPRAVVLFAGTNDISGSKPKTAQEILEGYQAFVHKVHSALPAAIIYYISITPTPSRWKLWPIAAEANRLIKACSESDRRLRFIDLTHVILDPDGKPDRSLYRFDRLHPNKKCYALWTATIKPVLLSEINSTIS